MRERKPIPARAIVPRQRPDTRDIVIVGRNAKKGSGEQPLPFSQAIPQVDREAEVERLSINSYG
jgi:hypothetical protein